MGELVVELVDAGVIDHVSGDEEVGEVGHEGVLHGGWICGLFVGG
jgi:hypothetical protein